MLDEPFLPWLRKQRARDDDIGAMARFYTLDPCMRGGTGTMRSIVRGWSAMEVTLRGAIAEWKAERVAGHDDQGG